MWYKKKTDPTALYVARQCGIEKEFEAVGPVLHEEDLFIIKEQFLQVSQDTIDQLFEKTTLKEVSKL